MTPAEAVARARSMIGRGEYRLGTGDYRPVAGRDEPWTTDGQHTGSDCSGFAQAWCWQMRRHRPGYNLHGSVVDWINTDSGIEDAYGRGNPQWTPQTIGKCEIYQPTRYPAPGDLLAYRSILRDGRRIRIGHVGIVVGVPKIWDPEKNDWNLLEIVQCHGPSGRRPGVELTTGHTWAEHDRVWGDVTWRRSVLLRVI